MKIDKDIYFAKLPFIISIVSGKGGVGKSVLTSNLANQLSKDGFKVLVWDGDFNFPNQHLIFGVEPLIRAKNVYHHQNSISQAVFKLKENLDLIADFPSEKLEEELNIDLLIEVFKYLLIETNYDFILIDTSAGLSEMMLNFINFSNLTLLIINDEPSSLLDGYALTKILLNFIKEEKIKILINNVIDFEDFQEISQKFSLVTKKFLKLEFETIGYVPYNRLVRKSLLNQELFTNLNDEEINSKMKEISKFISVYSNSKIEEIYY